MMALASSSLIVLLCPIGLVEGLRFSVGFVGMSLPQWDCCQPGVPVVLWCVIAGV